MSLRKNREPKVERYYSLSHFYFLSLLYILLSCAMFLGEEAARSRCKYGDCKKFNGKKKEMRKKIIEKLQHPDYIDTQKSIKSRLQSIQELERKEPSQVYIDRINGIFSSIQPLMRRIGRGKVLFIPETSKSVFTILTPSNKRKAEGYKNLISIVKFQKVKYELLKYFIETKYSIDEFWYLVKKLLIDDKEIFEILKWHNHAICTMEPNADNNQILKLSDEINYSPLLYNDNAHTPDKRYYIDNSIPSMDCKYLDSHSITKKNNVCANLALLNLYGYCHAPKIVEKINTCLHSFGNFTSSDCNNFSESLLELSKFNKSYIESANYILKRQILPLYFSIKLIPKLEPTVLNYKTLYHLIYTYIFQEWSKKVVNAKRALLIIKNKYSNNEYQCKNKIVVLDYLNKIVEDITSYENLMSNIYKIKSGKISSYMNKLPIWFPKLTSIITLPIRWKVELSNLIKENVDNSNAKCIFKMLESVLSELYNSSGGYIRIRLADLVYKMDPIYKIYAYIINIYKDDFSLKNLLNKNNSYAKIQEFLTVDYRLSLMHLSYTMGKCSKAVSSFDEFLEKLNYSSNDIEILQCLIKNKGNIKNCNRLGIFDVIINLLLKINIPDFNIGKLEEVVTNIAKHAGSDKISDIIDKYKVCCQGSCIIPEYCNSDNVKRFCAECINSQKTQGCNSIYNSDIQNAIKKCCFNGKIQQVNNISQKEKYDPCKLGYKFTENEYKWEYPEFRCSLGTDEQKKCYSLLLNTLGNLQAILQYLLKDSKGEFDSGEGFCSNPKEKLDNLCCNSIRSCYTCENFDKKLCEINISDVINVRQYYRESLKNILSENFLEFIENKIGTYGKNGFSEYSSCGSK